MAGHRGRGYRATRLRVWLYGLHALPNLYRRGRTQDRTLCHRHGIHGSRDDAPRDGCRMDTRYDRLHALLHLGVYLYTARHPGLRLS